jgi:hypothetical protein
MQTHESTQSVSDADITYDKNGRMNYHPELHGRQGKPWTTSEQAYLVAQYEIIGPEQMSLALERTIHTVMTRAYELRKKGLMPRPKRRVMHPRSGRGRSNAAKEGEHCAGALFMF